MTDTLILLALSLLVGAPEAPAGASGEAASPPPPAREAAPAPAGREAAPAPAGREAAPAPAGREAAPAPAGRETAPAPGKEAPGVGKARARALYKRGQRLFDKKQYREAIDVLRQAAALWPRREIYFNIALCHYELRERLEAATYLRRSLVGASERERRALPRPLRKLLARVGVVQVSVAHAEAEIWIDGRRRGQAKVEQVVRPGEVAVEIRLGGRTVARKLLQVGAGAVATWDLDRVVVGGGNGGGGGKPVPGPSWRRLHWAYLVGAAGLALVAAGGAVGLGWKTREVHDEFLATPSHALRDEGRRFQTATNVLWGVAGAAAVSAAVLAIFTRWRRESPAPPRVTWAPVLTPGGVGITGQF